MISYILISHGSMAVGVMDDLELVTGKTEHIYALGLAWGETTKSFSSRLELLIRKCLPLGEVIVVSDFFLGTPFNVTIPLGERYQFHHLTGMSMPMMLSLVCDYTEGANVQELCATALRKAKEQPMDVNQFVKEMKL